MLSNPGIITNCVNYGFVQGNERVGGINGLANNSSLGLIYDITISNCINTGVVEGNNATGSIAGSIYSVTITNCHYDKQFCIYKGVNGQDVPGVSPHLTSIWSVEN